MIFSRRWLKCWKRSKCSTTYYRRSMVPALNIAISNTNRPPSLHFILCFQAVTEMLENVKMFYDVLTALSWGTGSDNSCATFLSKNIFYKSWNTLLIFKLKIISWYVLKDQPMIRLFLCIWWLLFGSFVVNGFVSFISRRLPKCWKRLKGSTTFYRRSMVPVL